MSIIYAQGVSEIRGYEQLFVNIDIAQTYFLEIDIVEPSLQFPRLYCDVAQLVNDLPNPTDWSEVAHQRVWLNRVELLVRRDYGQFIVTQWSFNWAVEGASWRIWRV
jgi:hypothetical protein